MIVLFVSLHRNGNILSRLFCDSLIGVCVPVCVTHWNTGKAASMNRLLCIREEGKSKGGVFYFLMVMLQTVSVVLVACNGTVCPAAQVSFGS